MRSWCFVTRPEYLLSRCTLKRGLASLKRHFIIVMLEAADRAVAFKSMIKAWAQTRGMMATFMAKVSEKWPGRSGHIHISVASDGDNAFHDRDRFRSISKQMSQFIGRQLKYMSDFCVLAAPNFNSYKRLVPGCWVPACPIGADMNPYLALSCAIGSGIPGIEEDAALRASIVGDASEKTCHTSARLPQST